MVSPRHCHCLRAAVLNASKAADNGIFVGACKYAARNLDRVVLDKGRAADRPCNCTVGSLQLAAADDRFAVRNSEKCVLSQITGYKRPDFLEIPVFSRENEIY